MLAAVWLVEREFTIDVEISYFKLTAHLLEGTVPILVWVSMVLCKLIIFLFPASSLRNLSLRFGHQRSPPCVLQPTVLWPFTLPYYSPLHNVLARVV